MHIMNAMCNYQLVWTLPQTWTEWKMEDESCKIVSVQLQISLYSILGLGSSLTPLPKFGAILGFING